MAFTFYLLGISPLLDFFSHQQEQEYRPANSGVEYLGTHKCTLDAFIESVETVTPRQGWQLDEAVDTVVNFWLNNIDSVQHWKQRLEDAGQQNLIVARLAELNALRTEFDRLLD